MEQDFQKRNEHIVVLEGLQGEQNDDDKVPDVSGNSQCQGGTASLETSV